MKNRERTLYNVISYVTRSNSTCCFQLTPAAPAFKYSSPFQFMLEVSCWLLGWRNLLEWWRRSNKFGNLVPKKNLMFFSTVVTSKPEIARDTPVFWFYHFVLLDAFHHISAITWDQVFWHWIHLRRRRIKEVELEDFHACTFLQNGKQNKPHMSHLQLDSLHCCSLTSFMLGFT